MSKKSNIDSYILHINKYAKNKKVIFSTVISISTLILIKTSWTHRPTDKLISAQFVHSNYFNPAKYKTSLITHYTAIICTSFFYKNCENENN